MPTDYKKGNEIKRPRKSKVIKKDLLMQVRLAFIKYYNCDDEKVSDYLWKEWKNACVKAFPHHPINAWHKFELLKNMSRDLAHEPFETWCKVYAALGYEIR